jgi:hypothetical protein
MKSSKILMQMISIFLLYSACKKEAGEGGYATIKGKLYSGNAYSPKTAVSGDDVAVEEDVYIFYGNETVASDKITTAADGSFEFRFLQKGTYHLSAYSRDTTLVDSC